MLLGRDAERRQIDVLLRRARAGTSGVLVLRGEPGIGKTALLDYAAERAAPMRILRATGIEAETELAFAGLYSLLRPVAGLVAALPERHAAALRAALGLSHGAAPARLAVAAGTHGLLTTAAEGGALLLLADDLQWLDPATEEALMFAARRLGSDAIACVMTMRAGAPAPPGLPCRDIAGLDYAAAEQLVETVAGIRPAPAVARRLHAETGGNPLALAELSAALTADQLGGAEMPEVPLEPGAAIRQRFAGRLDQLSQPARTTLLVAAAAGSCLAAEVTTAAGYLDGGDSQALGEAEAAGLVRITAEGVQFCHPLLRSVAYHAAAPALRRAAHHALADVLAGRDAERAAWHRAAAATGPDEAAAAALDAAAGLAARKGAPLAAAAAWERAAELSGAAERRSARLAEAAEAALDGGDMDRVRRLTETMPAAPQPSRARMLAARGHLELLTGQTTAAQRSLREAADLLGGANPRLAVELLAESVYWTLEAGLFDVASQVAERMAELAERSDETARFLADYTNGYLAWRRGDAPHSGRVLRQAVARLDTDPALASNPKLQVYISWTWSNLGYPDRARRHCDQAVELARSQGAVGRLPDLLTLAASADVEAGRWSQALAHGSQALELALATGQTGLACEALNVIAEIEAVQGRDEDCRRHARDADRPELADRGHEVSIELALGAELMREGVRRHDPDLVIAPMLTTAIPADIWSARPCFIVHPGPKGDRGPSSLDWAIMGGAGHWGVTVLQANAEMDAGDVWASVEFTMPGDCSKGSLYRTEVADAALQAVLLAVARFTEGGYRPEPLDYSRPDVLGESRPPCRQEHRRVDWLAEPTSSVAAKLLAADSSPGVLDVIGDGEYFLFGGYEDDRLRGDPGAIIARRGGAVCRATVDGAVWISQLRPRRIPGGPETFKLPATLALRGLLGGVPEVPAPLTAPPGRRTYQEISYRESGGVGYLEFSFPGGAMSTDQCRRLLAAYRHAQARPVRVIVLGGPRDFFCNGIHLNVIEAADDPAEESWRNINAIDDLVKAILTTTDRLTVAAVAGNAAAGGLMLALAADEVWCRAGAVLNPHYRLMGLHGSEYWTYTLPRRVGVPEAARLTQACLPVSPASAARCGLVDRVIKGGVAEYRAHVAALAGKLARSPDYPARLAAKAQQLTAAQKQQPLAGYRAAELAIMSRNFSGPREPYAQLRRAFVHKEKPTRTPPHLARHRMDIDLSGAARCRALEAAGG